MTDSLGCLLVYLLIKHLCGVLTFECREAILLTLTSPMVSAR
jgi:hypothetical protein